MDINTRIYAQLQPSNSGLKDLVAIQGLIRQESRGHSVKPEQLHLTLLHFGKIEDIYEDLSAQYDVPYEVYIKHLGQFVKDAGHLMSYFSCTLNPVRFNGFGPNKRTLVVEYEMTDELRALHSNLLKLLQAFFVSCGVVDTKAFIINNGNLMHSFQLRPHIALYKGYEGTMPSHQLQPIKLSPMKLIY